MDDRLREFQLEEQVIQLKTLCRQLAEACDQARANITGSPRWAHPEDDDAYLVCSNLRAALEAAKKAEIING